MLKFMDPEDVIDYYLRRELRRVRERVSGSEPETKYSLSLEPVSALFAVECDVTVDSIVDAYDPIKARVLSTVNIVWNKYALKMISELQQYGIDVRDFSRTGGAYQSTVANKVLAKWEKQRNPLIYTSMDLWRRPWWQEIGLPKLLRLLDLYHKKSLSNIEYFNIHPEDVTSGKPPDTGTGWKFPIDTRANLARNFSNASVGMREVIDQYYKDMKEAVAQWPDRGAVIYTGGSYNGIVGGVRSDPDVIEWSGDLRRQIISSQTREVGNDPSSVVHNRKVNPAQWQTEAVWRVFCSEYHYLPQDVEGYAIAMTTKPATIPGEDENELVLVGGDAGWTDNPAVYRDNRLVVPKDTQSFGADNISLRGIFLFTNTANWIRMLKSGTPYTMSHYLMIFGDAIAAWAREHNITPNDLRILQVGDDMQIIIRRKFISQLMLDLGSWIRCKGMKVTKAGHAVFILGHWVVWHEDGTITQFIAPRGLKSVTSAKATEKVPKTVELHKKYPLIAEEDAIQQITQYWERYREMIIYHGDPESRRNWLTANFIEQKIEIAKQLGLSEWVLDIFPYEESLKPAEVQLPKVEPQPETIAEAEQRQNIMPTEEVESPPKVIQADQLATDAEEAAGEEESKGMEPVEEATSTEDPYMIVKDLLSKRTEPIRVYANITCGKSTLLKQLRDHGIEAVDTDEFMDEVIAKLRNEGKIVGSRPWRDPKSPDYQVYHNEMLAMVQTKLKEDHTYKVLLSNMWPIFGQDLPADIGTIRTNVDRIEELIHKRGDEDELPRETIELWVSDQMVLQIREHIPSLRILEDDEYLEDVFLEYVFDQHRANDAEGELENQ